MNNYYYNKLKDLSDSGRLATHIIIAPPRANSSLVEHVIGNSPDIDAKCHEPFIKSKHDDFDSDYGYQQIYESISGKEVTQKESKSIVIKEMSYSIGNNMEYKRLVELTANPITILIRNPLLTVESRVRRVIKTMDMRYSIDLQRYLLDEIAIERGFKKWSDIVQSVKQGRSNMYLDFLQDEEDVERLYDTPILTIQNRLLDIKAKKSEYSNWRDLIEKKLYIDRDLKFFEGVLKSKTRRLAYEREEFEKLEETVGYLEDKEKDYIVCDTTDLRANPRGQFQELCKRLGIRFTPEMLKWNNGQIDFHTEQKKQSEKMWYDTLYSSSQVNPPIEISPTLETFPDHIKDYLKSSDLPIYSRLAKHKISSGETKHELNEREFMVRVTPSTIEQVSERRLSKGNLQVGDQVVLKLKHIDPVYAITNEPKLVENQKFKKFGDIYSNEIDIMTNSHREQGEHLDECNMSDEKRIKFR